MNDSCCVLSIRFRRCDLEKMRQAFDGQLGHYFDIEEMKEKPGIIRAESEVESYCYWDELEEAARLGVIMHGYHTPGNDHDGSLLCASGNTLHVVPALIDSEYPLVEVLSDGTIDRVYMDAALNYNAAFKEVQREFEAEMDKARKQEAEAAT